MLLVCSVRLSTVTMLCFGTTLTSLRSSNGASIYKLSVYKLAQDAALAHVQWCSSTKR